MSAVLSFPMLTRDQSSPAHLRSPIDLTDLSDEKVASLRVSVSEFRLAQQRVGYELYYMIQRLKDMQDILGGRFESFVESELDISGRTARRYLQIHRVMSAHFVTSDGTIDVAHVSKLSQNALRLLTPDTDEEVIAEIKEIASKGGKVDEATVRQIMQSREKDYEARLATATAEAETANREKEAMRAQHELETARLKTQIIRNDELLRRANETREALEKELAELNERATIVEERTVTKEVLPEGYVSAVEAVSAEQKKLVDIQNRKAQIEQQLAALESERQHMAELHAGAEEFIKLKEQVDSILLKYPLARLQMISSADKNIKQLVHGLGEAMAELGKQLQAGSAK